MLAKTNLDSWAGVWAVLTFSPAPPSHGFSLTLPFSVMAVESYTFPVYIPAALIHLPAPVLILLMSDFSTRSGIHRELSPLFFPLFLGGGLNGRGSSSCLNSLKTANILARIKGMHHHVQQDWLYLQLCVCVALCVWALSYWPDVGSLGTEVTIGCELLDMGAGNRTWAPWESSTCSCLLSPFYFLFPESLWDSVVLVGHCEIRKFTPKPLRVKAVVNYSHVEGCWVLERKELSLSAFVFIWSEEFSCCRSREGNKRLSLLEITWQLLQSRDNPAAWFSYFLV